MKDYAGAVRGLLSAAECRFVRRGRGSHDIWFSPITEKNIVVPTKIVVRHTANGILEQAGLIKQF